MKRFPAELILLSLLVAGCETYPSATTGNNSPRGYKGPAVGQAAPDISGVDIDGVEFKLSDYRGKVVMLDFWGLW